MCFNWHGAVGAEEIINIGPLALVAPLLERLDLAAIIDRHLPPDPQLEFSHGQVLSLLLAARLSHPTALVHVGTWAEKSGADVLWNIPAAKLNDDRLGRALEFRLPAITRETLNSTPDRRRQPPLHGSNDRQEDPPRSARDITLAKVV